MHRKIFDAERIGNQFQMARHTCIVKDECNEIYCHTALEATPALFLGRPAPQPFNHNRPITTAAVRATTAHWIASCWPAVQSFMSLCLISVYGVKFETAFVIIETYVVSQLVLLVHKSTKLGKVTKLSPWINTTLPPNKTIKLSRDRYTVLCLILSYF